MPPRASFPALQWAALGFSEPGTAVAQSLAWVVETQAPPRSGPGPGLPSSLWSLKGVPVCL